MKGHQRSPRSVPRSFAAEPGPFQPPLAGAHLGSVLSGVSNPLGHAHRFGKDRCSSNGRRCVMRLRYNAQDFFDLIAFALPRTLTRGRELRAGTYIHLDGLGFALFIVYATKAWKHTRCRGDRRDVIPGAPNEHILIADVRLRRENIRLIEGVARGLPFVDMYAFRGY
ncbi:hypothetical protein BD309DRAFT_732966 [Dichomitus squalens]|nr:hypothetical protein BD309DRAFT_732966 [Dichomitus squalens]